MTGHPMDIRTPTRADLKMRPPSAGFAQLLHGGSDRRPTHWPVKRSSNRGFTLIEALITISIMVVLMGLAAPSMFSILTRNQAASYKSSLTSSIALARSEAARTGWGAIIQSGGGSAGNELAQGWSVYLDVDASGSVNAGDTLLRTYEAPPTNVSISGPATLKLSSSGGLVAAGAQTYTICHVGADSAAGSAYSVIVAPSGSVLTRTLTGAVTC